MGKIIKGDPLKEMASYKGRSDATAKKTISNVLVEGDSYFRSGDILTADEFGWLYFKDRIGDTFRQACR